MLCFVHEIIVVLERTKLRETHLHEKKILKILKVGRPTRDNSDIIVQRECGWGMGRRSTKKILIYLSDRFHHDHTAKMLKC